MTKAETPHSAVPNRPGHADATQSAAPLHPITSAAEARQAMESLLLPAGTGSNAFGKIDRVGIGANSYGLRIDPLTSDMKRLLAENRDLETTALASLSEPDRRRYTAIANCLADRPASRIALQLLLVEGGFADTARPATDGTTLLQTLADLATGKTVLTPSVSKDGLLGDLVHELAFPSAINQSSKATCTVTSMQIMMAKYRPAEYARLIAGLVTDRGEVTLADGRSIRRTPDSELPDSSSRTTSSRIFEAAMMEFANGPSYCYDNTADRSENAKGDTYAGAGLSEVQSATAALIGSTGTVQSVRVGATPQQFANYAIQTKTDVLAHIAETLATGNPVLVSLKSSAPPDPAHPETRDRHEVLLVGATADNVQILNPWGLEETLTWADVTRMLETATFVTLNEIATPAQPPVAENPAADVSVVREAPLPPITPPKLDLPPPDLSVPPELVAPVFNAEPSGSDSQPENLATPRERLEPLPEPRKAKLTLPTAEVVTPVVPITPISVRPADTVTKGPSNAPAKPSPFTFVLHAAKAVFETGKTKLADLF